VQNEQPEHPDQLEQHAENSAEVEDSASAEDSNVAYNYIAKILSENKKAKKKVAKLTLGVKNALYYLEESFQFKRKGMLILEKSLENDSSEDCDAPDDFQKETAAKLRMSSSKHTFQQLPGVSRPIEKMKEDNTNSRPPNKIIESSESQSIRVLPSISSSPPVDSSLHPSDLASGSHD
jgi:hypothetical protein